jgi:2-succinyl-5-enolpyruvyl-6-hydroxy-3-cyclohexene-1-carboxylate synthase
VGRVTTNQALALEVLHALVAAGVRTFCVCPGGRNAPFVEALATPPPGIEVIDFFEERSAAFFALGRARRDDRPAAVITTSGTACAELLPAIVEAHYSCTPLLAVTADRPRSYRGTGAPQVIEQPGLFGVYVQQAVDLDTVETSWRLDVADGPCHINVCFEEPLLAGWEDRGVKLPPDGPRDDRRGRPHPHGSRAVPQDAPPDWLHDVERPLVMLGALPDPADQQVALEFCERLQAPVLAEASSHLKGRLGRHLLRGSEVSAGRAVRRGVFDAVIRIGNIPSFRLWRDLESEWAVPVLSVSRRPWPGLTRGTVVHVPRGCPLSVALPSLAAFPCSSLETVLADDREVEAVVTVLLDRYPLCEPAIVRKLSQAVPGGAFVYLGNSQPIREWNQFAEERSVVFGESRGANGIDGQLSTFLGATGCGRENWAIVGDLTALYDLQAPWALANAGGAVRIVILNNGGGKIFQRMFANPRFQNRHDLRFPSFAALWGLEYRADLPAGEWSARAGVIELRPDPGETDAFWAALAERARQ